MEQRKQKALLIRMDRIGDLVLTLSCDQSPYLQYYDCSWVINKGLSFVPESSVPPRKFEEVAKDFNWKDFWNFVQKIKSLQPDVVIVFHAPWWVGLALFVARVRLRITRYSQWHSFLFFNKGLRQKRSRGQRHESDFNFDLIELVASSSKNSLPPPPDSRAMRPFLELSAKESEFPSFLKQNDVSKDYYVIHPGMAGSALNWPSAMYRELIQNLSKTNKVVITGTEADAPYVNPLRGYFSKNPAVIFADKQLNIQQLLSVLSKARAVVAPSTGVVHLAASVGAATVGIYSPIAAEQALRWGPRGKFVATVSPEAEVSESHPKKVMELISVQDVEAAIASLEQSRKAQTRES